MAEPKIKGDMLTRARAWLNNFSTLHGNIDSVRDIVRQRVRTAKSELEKAGVIAPETAHALALLLQLRAFADGASWKIEVLPTDDSQDEEKVTQKIGNWCYGVADVIAAREGLVYRDAIFHAIESGYAILTHAFDTDKARRSDFPFMIRALDPRNCAWYPMRSPQPTFFLETADRYAAEVLEDLESRFMNARGVKIPEWLGEMGPSEMVTQMTVLDETHEYYYLDDALVYQRAHLCNGVPVAIGTAFDLPSDFPEERAFGAVFPNLDLLKVESKLLAKAVTDFELYTRSLGIVVENGSPTIRQLNIGTQGDPGTQIQPAQVTPNHALLQELNQMSQGHIQRSTLSELAFGSSMMSASGYALANLTSGMAQRMTDIYKPVGLGMEVHFAALIDMLGRFNTAEMSKKFAKGEADQWAKAFATYYRPKGGAMGHKRMTQVVPTPEEVEGHTRVKVSLEPRMPQDKGASIQQAEMLLRSFGPGMREYILRDVLKVEEADWILTQIEREEMRQKNPVLSEYFDASAMDDMLKSDPQLKKFIQAKMAEAMAQEQQAQMQPPMMGQQPQMMPPDAGGMGVPGMGGAGMPPPQMFGQTPPNPQDVMQDQLMAGAGGAPAPS